MYIGSDGPEHRHYCDRGDNLVERGGRRVPEERMRGEPGGLGGNLGTTGYSLEWRNVTYGESGI